MGGEDDEVTRNMRGEEADDVHASRGEAEHEREKFQRQGLIDGRNRDAGGKESVNCNRRSARGKSVCR